jgi:TonB family protein
METVEHPRVQPEDDLQLLLDWTPDRDETARLRAAIIGTILVHLLLIGGLAAVPHQTATVVRVPERRPMQVTKLIDPPIELTQRAPNKGKITKELAVQSPSPSIPVPQSGSGAQSRKFTPPPTPQQKKEPTTAPAVVEPPKIEQAQNNTPQLQLPQLPAPAPPPERPTNNAKLNNPFETPAAPAAPKGNGRIPVPGGSPIQEAVRDLSHGGNKGLSGSDTFDLGSGSGLNIPPSPGRPRMDYELKSDPQGVDFRPYILQVLAIVRRNWFSVYPESAKLGTRGQVKLEFAVAKDGKVTKVVFSSQSGTQALDRAAVAAISQSNPLPGLPAEYHGERIVLAFTFSYNLGR